MIRAAAVVIKRYDAWDMTMLFIVILLLIVIGVVAHVLRRRRPKYEYHLDRKRKD